MGTAGGGRCGDCDAVGCCDSHRSRETEPSKYCAHSTYRNHVLQSFPATDFSFWTLDRADFLFLARISALSAGWGCRERQCAENYNTQQNKFILFKIFAISISVISHRNSFRVLFDNIASAYFISKIYLYFATENGQPRNQH